MLHRPSLFVRIRHVSRRSLLPLLLVATATWNVGHAQFRPLIRGASEDGTNSSSTGMAGDRSFPAAAPLNVDGERERLLERALKYAEEGQIEPAVERWQQMLHEPRNRIHSGRVEFFETMRKTIYGRYTTLGAEIEKILATSSPEILRVYRQDADPIARSLFNERTEDRRRALSRIVRGYFLSSYGDDAAYELAAFHFDRGESPDAARLLVHILEDYPNSDIPREKILFRLTLAEARMGHVASARRQLAELRKLPVIEVSQELRETAAREIESTAHLAMSRTAASDWRMSLGNPSRTGRMPSPPADLLQSPLTEEWIADRKPSRGSHRNSVIAPSRARQMILNRARRVPHVVIGNSDRLAEEWKRNDWNPVTSLLLEDGRVYHAGDVELICRDARSGELLWRSPDYQYEMTALSQLYSQQANTNGTGRRPRSPNEIRLFGDRVHQAMSLGAGVVYVVEGRIADAESTNNRMRALQRRSRRVRRNWLSCYHAENGKLLWTRQASDADAGNDMQAGEVDDIGFLAAPVESEGMLYVPVTDRGAVWIYALDPRQAGEIRWKTFLCDEPLGSASPWSPVAIACAGGDVYVCPGTGVVFALNTGTGDVQWAVRYRRSGIGNRPAMVRGRNGNFVLPYDGWADDTLIAHEGRLIALPSDYDHVFALDRRSGALLWDSPRQPDPAEPKPTYCLGIHEDKLYVAGPNIVRYYDAQGGKMSSSKHIDDSYGRGFLSDAGIYVPLADTVLRLDLETLETIGEARFVSPAAEPLGNLFSDGNRLLVAAPERVYALVGLDNRLRSLAARISERDGRARFERMRLRMRLGEFELALEDLESGWPELNAQAGLAEATKAVYDGIDELELVSKRPRIALRILLQLHETARDATPDEREKLAKQSEHHSRIVFSILNAFEQSGKEENVTTILDGAPLYVEYSLLRAACLAIGTSATPEQAESLLEGLADENVTRRAVAAAALSVALGDEAQPQFVKLLEDPEDEVRLIAAVELANKGDRRSIPVLDQLLESERIHIRIRSVQVLRGLTSRNFSFAAYDDPVRRREAAENWHAWVREHAETAELNFPIANSSLLLGRTLFVVIGSNTVYELDASGKISWQQHFNSPFCCQGLPNGHRLIASSGGGPIIEYDAQGKVFWKIDKLPSASRSARRLRNGNTLVCMNSGMIREYRPDKSVAWNVRIDGNPMDARRLPNGNTLVALYNSQQIAEIDRQGKVVWKQAQNSRPICVQPLQNGNMLICQSSHGQVVERTRKGEVIWKKTGLSQPYSAQRLPNGNTLISDRKGVQEVDLEGNVVWERSGNVVRSAHRF